MTDEKRRNVDALLWVEEVLKEKKNRLNLKSALAPPAVAHGALCLDRCPAR